MAWGSGWWPAKRWGIGWVEGAIAMDGTVLGRLVVFGSAVVVGTAASAIAPIVPIAIAGTALAGVAGGIFANELGALNTAPGNPDLRNAHLTRAIGQAVGMGGVGSGGSRLGGANVIAVGAGDPDSVERAALGGGLLCNGGAGFWRGAGVGVVSNHERVTQTIKLIVRLVNSSITMLYFDV